MTVPAQPYTLLQAKTQSLSDYSVFPNQHSCFPPNTDNRVDIQLSREYGNHSTRAKPPLHIQPIQSQVSQKTRRERAAVNERSAARHHQQAGGRVCYLVPDDNDGKVVRVHIQPHQQLFSPHGHLATTATKSHVQKDLKKKKSTRYNSKRGPKSGGGKYKR